MREPETLTELRDEILRQLEHSETVTIRLTEGDGVHELLESIQEGIDASRKQTHMKKENEIRSQIQQLEQIINLREDTGLPSCRLTEGFLLSWAWAWAWVVNDTK